MQESSCKNVSSDEKAPASVLYALEQKVSDNDVKIRTQARAITSLSSKLIDDSTESELAALIQEQKDSLDRSVEFLGHTGMLGFGSRQDRQKVREVRVCSDGSTVSIGFPRSTVTPKEIVKPSAANFVDGVWVLEYQEDGDARLKRPEPAPRPPLQRDYL